jgi:hypothetical protein
MRYIVAAILIVLGGCAGPGTVSARRNGDGIVFRFGEKNRPGIHLIGVDVFEVESGRRGRTVCGLQLKKAAQYYGAPLTEWAYGKEPQGGDYETKDCIGLAPNVVYGIAGYRYDHRLVWIHFVVHDDGTVHELRSPE